MPKCGGEFMKTELETRLERSKEGFKTNDEWKKYTEEELEWWVKLLTKRATMRADGPKKDKDLECATCYNLMLQEKRKEKLD